MNKFNIEYEKNGFCIIKNFFSKSVITKILYEIAISKNIDVYFDKIGNLRRVERLYDKGTNLRLINKKIINFLKKKFKMNLVIFKDKFNAKPPGGEGFYAHYDGIFYFKNNSNKTKKGWYEYSDYFINILVALDNCSSKNGTIELAKIDNGNFLELYKKTKKDGTPNIKNSFLKKLLFKPIKLNAGDIVIFSNKVPHKSKKNSSSLNRRTLYYTYCKKLIKDPYKKYFNDKMKSKNKTSKSLSGQI